MMRNLILSIFLAGLMATPALASDGDEILHLTQGRPDPSSRYSADEARDARRTGNIVSALEVIRQVRQRYPGADVLDAELEGGVSPRYIVRVLTRDGRRIDVVVDARTGRILYER